MFPQGSSLFGFAGGIDFQSEVYGAFFVPTVTSWAVFLPCRKPFSGRDCNRTSKGGETMAVFRGERNKGYAVMSKHHLQNRELSLKAKVQFSQMMSLPKDWDYTLLLRLETPLDFSLIIRYHKNESIFGFERECFYAASIKRRSF